MSKTESPAERVYNDLLHYADHMIEFVNRDIDFHALACQGCETCDSHAEMFHKLLHRIAEDVSPNRQTHLLAAMLLRESLRQRTSAT